MECFSTDGLEKMRSQILARSDNDGRAEGLLDIGGTRHGSIIYSGCAARLFGISHPPYARGGSAFFRVRSITTTQASMLVHRPWSCGHQPGRVASNGHEEGKVSQLPGFAHLQEGAQCDSLVASRVGLNNRASSIISVQASLAMFSECVCCALR